MTFVAWQIGYIHQLPLADSLVQRGDWGQLEIINACSICPLLMIISGVRMSHHQRFLGSILTLAAIAVLVGVLALSNSG